MSWEVFKPVKTEAGYDAAWAVIVNLMGAVPNTPESDDLKVLVTLVAAYEANRWPMDAPDPIGSIPQRL